MKKFNILKIVKIVLAVLTAAKVVHEEVTIKKGVLPENGLDPIDNTDPQNPNYPPKK